MTACNVVVTGPRRILVGVDSASVRFNSKGEETSRTTTPGKIYQVAKSPIIVTGAGSLGFIWLVASQLRWSPRILRTEPPEIARRLDRWWRQFHFLPIRRAPQLRNKLWLQVAGFDASGVAFHYDFAREGETGFRLEPLGPHFSPDLPDARHLMKVGTIKSMFDLLVAQCEHATRRGEAVSPPFHCWVLTPGKIERDTMMTMPVKPQRRPGALVITGLPPFVPPQRVRSAVDATVRAP